MNLNLRIFLGYFLIIGLAAYLFINAVISEIRPGVRQSTEDSLIDMANLLAEVVSREFNKQQLQQSQFAKNVELFFARHYQADIYSITKTQSNLRIYITDQQGLVIYDSDLNALGHDYSQWRDVYLTLRGQYGARSTRSNPLDESSSVMHVAAAIKNGDQIIGVLTVAKPSLTVQPFIELAQGNIRQTGLYLVIASLLTGGFLAYWLTGSIRQLTQYADNISQGKSSALPVIRDSELNQLGQAMEKMRSELEGKKYIEHYTHSLTHELKSPVAAIKAAAELIHSDMPKKDLQHFINNISQQTNRLDDLVNRMLELASLETRHQLKEIESIPVAQLIETVINSKKISNQQKQLNFESQINQDLIIEGEEFLITQAIDNLLQNAIDFSQPGSRIKIEADLSIHDPQTVTIRISNYNANIPDYALSKIYDRFYSLPRPETDESKLSKKSSGLGLNFVREIAHLHRGDISLKNSNENNIPTVIATLKLPIKQ